MSERRSNDRRKSGGDRKPAGRRPSADKKYSDSKPGAKRPYKKRDDDGKAGGLPFKRTPLKRSGGSTTGGGGRVRRSDKPEEGKFARKGYKRVESGERKVDSEGRGGRRDDDRKKDFYYENTGDKGNFGERDPETGERKPRKLEGEDREHKPTGDKRGYGRSTSGEKKGYGVKRYGPKRVDSGEGKEVSEGRGSRRDDDTTDRSAQGESGERKPFERGADSEGRERKPYERRAEGETGERKPYERREGGDRERKPYGDRERTERKPYERRADSEGGERKQYGASKSYGTKRFERSDDKERGERKAEGGEKKPFRSRDTDNRGSGEKSYGRKGWEDREITFGKKRNDDSKPYKRKRDDAGDEGFSGEAKPFADNETLRLNKFIANAGICSRRQADEYIADGAVTVNGEVVREMGHRVKKTDVVTFKGQKVEYGRKVYILLNKPKDFLTTVTDDRGRGTVMELIQGATDEKVYPVGRLDRNTTGLLLLTNDGELTQQLTHPSFGVTKVYHVSLDKPVAVEDMEKIAAGVELEDGVAQVDDIAYADAKDKSQVGIELHIGKNRIVRRIFETLGYDVRKLDRVLYAGISKKDLPRGRWRFLTEKEVIQLKKFNEKR